jgi:hypothetical protein
MDNTDIKSIALTAPTIGKKQGSQTVKGKIKHTVGSEMTSELLPFRSVMKRQLQHRGYNTKVMPFNMVVPLYYNEFVSKQVNKNSYFEAVDCYDFYNNPVFKFSLHDNLNGEVASWKNRDYFLQVSDVTNRIIDTFRASKEKKHSLILSGSSNFDVDMTNDELVQAKVAERVEANLKDKLSGSQPVTMKTFKTILIIAGVFILLNYLAGK